METFLPRYFAILDQYSQDKLQQGSLLVPILASSEEMVRNVDPALTNRDVFWQHFTQQTGLDRVYLEKGFDQFYQTEFRNLESITEKWPAAVELVRTSFAKRLQVVIATNPMFPRTAVEARLEWAGVPLSDFPYDLITSYENMHAVKPHLTYYQEILDIVGCRPENALMVGDDWQRDIEPAATLGLFTFWIQLSGTNPPDASLPTAYGSLEGLLARLQSSWLQRLAVPT